MRLLFLLNKKNYNENWPKFVRPSVRGVIIRDGKVAMVHSLKYDYYKFPGGGIDPSESHIDCLIREVKEESGLTVIPSSVREFGNVIRAEAGKGEEIFYQENFYYLCCVEDMVETQNLDDYEAEEHFTLEWITPEVAISANRKPDHGPKSNIMIEREAKVLEILIEEGYF
ncbi:MAG: NUDIX domain-containing protein [Ruminococcaceae bacterium]|nr:NUDIX domain-containing protein [Oscillospiraceae bacterium]